MVSVGRTARSLVANRIGADAALSAAIAAGGVLLALYLGRALAWGRLGFVLYVVGGIAALVVFDRLTLAGWCGLILIAAVAARGIVDLLGLPTVLNYAHYPLVLAFALAALMRASGRDARRASAGAWLVGMVVLATISMLANGSHPMRALIFVAIVGEPLLLIWAIQRWGDDVRARRLVKLAAVLLLAQVPLGLWQGATYDWGDAVLGTLTGQGAGAHVLGGLFALGALMVSAAVLAGRVRTGLGVIVVAGAFGMMIAGDAMQVVLAAAFALVILPIIGGGASEWGRGVRRAALGMLAVVLAGGGIYFVEVVSPGRLDRAEGLARDDRKPEVVLIEERAESNMPALIMGSGPGTTASRASVLLTPQMMTEDSPLASLNLPPTDFAREWVLKTSSPWGGSAESFVSSSVGIIGDLGLVGFAMLGFLFLRIWQEAAHAGTWLQPAARASIVMMGILMFVDSWLEYPEFTLPLAVMLGFSLSRRGPAAERKRSML